VADATVGFQGWGASGVGWGEDPWGQSLASLPTGTGQVGSVTVLLDASVSVTGLSANASVGSVTVTGSANVSPSGVSATASVGSVSVTGTANVSPCFGAVRHNKCGLRSSPNRD